MLHEHFERLLKALSFQPHQIRFLIETAKTMLIEPIRIKQERLKEKVEALTAVNEKIYKLEERLMNNEIESSTYQTWFKKFKEEKAVLELALDDKKKPKVSKSDDMIERLLPELSNIYQI